MPCAFRFVPPKWFRPLVAAVALSTGCAGTQAPAAKAPSADARAEDAAALPSFSADTRPADVERFQVHLGDAPTRGPATAPVTVVMFSDFECPYCQQGYRTLRALERRYEGRVRIAYKAFPLDFHSNALPAAIAARTAQAQGKFWEFHDRLFAGDGTDLPALLGYARDVGIDPASVQRDLDSLAFGPQVSRDIRQARRLGVNSTPTFYINGREISGARPIDELAAVVDEELALANTWLAEGVKPEDLYQRAIRDGYKSVAYTGARHRLDPDAVMPVPLGDSPARGNPDALVTIVVFGDFECPFCARGNATIERLRKRYGPLLREVYKHSPLPFHSHAFVAARASLAAGAQGKFWEFHDALYATNARFDEDVLVKIAKQLGLNTKAFTSDIKSAKFDPVIDQDMALAASLGVTGTPAYFVNGRPVEGALPELHFRLVIEEELVRARAALQAGTPPSQLYEVLSHQPLPQ